MIKINGGATVWARQTIDSEIFYNKSDVWFKIWFYLVNQVNHKDDKRFKRGSCFLKYEWIMDKTGATKNQVKHCIEFLKKDKMLATQKATRGFIVKVNKYTDYQTLDNYKKPQEKESKRNTEGTQKEHRSHTINKYVKNVNNVNKRTILENWLNYRKTIKKPITNDSTLELLIKRFNSEPIEKIEWTVNLSIENVYQGLLWDKYKENSSVSPKPQKRINHYVYKCPSCNKEYHPRVMKGEDDFDAYRCDENACQKVGLGSKGKNMVGYALDFIKVVLKE